MCLLGLRIPFSISRSMIIGTATASSEREEDVIGDGEDGRWDSMPPEIMRDIIHRLDSNDETWPSRKNVVACGGVCRKWREITLGIVKPPSELHGLITFPSSLKQSGLRDPPLHCIIRRNKRMSTFYLYLNSKQSFSEKGKFLFAARRSRHGARINYVISLDHDDISQRSKAYVGKLRSNFLGTKFTLFDSEAPFDGARSSNKRASRRFMSKQISPHVPSANYVVGQISYKFNILKPRGPRRMKCALQYPSTPSTSSKDSNERALPKSSPSVILKNKAPRWHEQLQCWCLNFHGRVTVASVKNFQLVATSDPTQPNGLGDEVTVLLQFGKVADDVFTMDFRKPLSVFQAFAICLTSFGTKPACE